jgi:hypothetical protein
MRPSIVELWIFVVVFIGVVLFVWTKIASDLPDDFLSSARSRMKKKEGGDGRLRDHG